MDATLKNFFDTKKSLIADTKLPAIRKQKTEVPKVPKHMQDKPLENDPYRKFANSVIKDKPSKKDLVEKIQQFIDAAEALL
jgi:hypothetical protein